MTERNDLAPAAGEFLVFVADDGTAQVHVRLADGTGSGWPAAPA
jgi:hypothetical protein